MNIIAEVQHEAVGGGRGSVQRLEQCIALARIFRQSADDISGDRSKSARYWQVSLQYDAEAARQANLLAISA